MVTDEDNNISTKKHWPLDDVLQEAGKFGRYQIFLFAALFFPVMLHGAYTVAFVFTAGDLNYRCRIPECDGNVTEQNVDYKPVWLENAVPFKNNLPSQCIRYAYISDDNLNSSLSGTCDINRFDNTKLVECDDFIYEDHERTLLNEVSVLILF